MTVRERLVPIDVLKSVGIVTVVWIHTVAGAVSPAEHYVLEVTRFAVPGFLAASGFLYAMREPIAFATTRNRLRRLLLPYFVASALAEVYWWAAAAPHSWPQIVRDLLYGSSFGPYYFVFAITTMVLLAPLLARVPPARMLALWGTLFMVRTMLLAIVVARPNIAPGNLFWAVRDPSFQGTYFIAGWICSLHRHRLGTACRKHRRVLLVMGGAMALLLSMLAIREDAPVVAALASWANTFVVVGVVVLYSLGLRSLPGALRFLSEASYAFYLYHLFFVFTVLRAVPPPATSGARLLLQIAALAAGLVGPGLLTVASRRVLGARARSWIGA